MNIAMLPFKGRNPLVEQAVIMPEVPDLEKFSNGQKVKEIFLLPDGTWLMVNSDRMGAFDQKHLMADGITSGHYAGKGPIMTALNAIGKSNISRYVPTDEAPWKEEYYEVIPSNLMDRCSVHFPAQKRHDVEWIVRSACEGSMAKKIAEGKLVCGHKLPSDIKKGDSLKHLYPLLTPTTKSGPGGKDMNITIPEALEKVGDEDEGQYIYGAVILVHLDTHIRAREAGYEIPDQKCEFARFSERSGIIPKGDLEFDLISAKKLFRQLCEGAGFRPDAWEQMPHFDINKFAKYAQGNMKNVRTALIDDCGTTDDCRWRPVRSSNYGRWLREQGAEEQAMFFLTDFYCKQWFRQESGRTGLGGYDINADQKVPLPDVVYRETGKRNFKVLCDVWNSGSRVR